MKNQLRCAVASSLILWGQMTVAGFPAALLRTNCYSNTTLLAEAVADAPAGQHNTFVLCSNTYFHINNAWSDSEDMMLPLVLRSETTIQCGHDGDPHNQCVFSGAPDTPLVVSLHDDGTEENLVNAVVQGVTFYDEWPMSNTFETSAVLGNAGGVRFVNCLFQVREFGDTFCMWVCW